jgi:thiol-disulfide isomerase/thioredoxin
MKKGALIFWVGVLLLVVGGIGMSVFVKTGPGNLDGFTQCLEDKGAIFYGAFWCPHCQRTKALFGSSAHLLPYVECSTPDGKEQLQICKDKGIQSYPTWTFADGSTLNGERTLKELSDKTGCVLPE